MRDWMEMHHPRLIGLWDWPRYRLFGRCMVCGRPMVLHAPWALYICERRSLPIEIAQKSWDLLADAEARATEPAYVA